MTRTTHIAGKCLLLLVLPVLALAQVTFERRWHWFREDFGRSVALADNGGYLVGGEAWVDTTQYDIILAWVDSLGETTLVRDVPRVEHGSGFACGLGGGGFVTAGTRSGFHILAEAFNPAGDSVWSYGPARRGRVNGIIATGDGGCLIFGRDSLLDMGAVRLDSAGNEEWAQSYDEPRVQGSTVNGVAETRDSGFILCGDATDYMGSYVRLVRTNPAGDTLWTRLIAGPSGPSLQGVCETSDHGFLAVGSEFDAPHSRNVVYLLRTDSAGTTVWTRDISPADTTAGAEAAALCVTRDGGYVIAGKIDWVDSARVWLARLDADADTVWTSPLPGTGREQAVAIRQTADGGYVVAGTTDHDGGSVLLFKTDSVGHVDYGIAEGREVSGTHRGFSIAPNPARGVVHIESSLPNEPVVRLKLYDTAGKLVQTLNGTACRAVTVRNLPSGVYVLRLESADSRTALKLVVE